MFDDLDLDKNNKNNNADAQTNGEAGQVKQDQAPAVDSSEVEAKPVSPVPPPLRPMAGNSTSTPPTEPASNPNPEFDQRLQKLEEKGRKRGKRFSKIGIVTGFGVALIMMGIGYYLLTQVIDFTEKAGESAGNVANIGRQPKSDNTGEQTTSKPLELPIGLRGCSVDSDCVAIQAGCCSCTSGGKQTAINRLHENDWKKTITNSCSQVDCPAVDNCLTGEAKCINDICEFRELGEDGPTCAVAGETISTIPLPSDQTRKECCPGLVEKDSFIDEDCTQEMDVVICVSCPDGECGTGENSCNCPEDCSVATTTEECLGEDCHGSTETASSTESIPSAPIIPIDTSDPDNDGLNNQEEAIYGTDPMNPDTDGDGYTDGSEVSNGYNPLGEGKLNP